MRRSGKTHIQTVKSEANGHGVATNRGEWERPINQDERDVGRLAETPALAKAAKAIKDRLEPVFVTDIRRTIGFYTSTTTRSWKRRSRKGRTKPGAALEPVSELVES